LVNTRNKALNAQWSTYRRERHGYLLDIARKSGIDVVELSTDGPVVEPLTRFFDARRKRM